MVCKKQTKQNKQKQNKNKTNKQVKQKKKPTLFLWTQMFVLEHDTAAEA